MDVRDQREGHFDFGIICVVQHFEAEISMDALAQRLGIIIFSKCALLYCDKSLVRVVKD